MGFSTLEKWYTLEPYSALPYIQVLGALEFNFKQHTGNGSPSQTLHNLRNGEKLSPVFTAYNNNG